MLEHLAEQRVAVYAVMHDLRNDVCTAGRQIYICMKNPPINSLVWGSLRLAPISNDASSLYLLIPCSLKTTPPPFCRLDLATSMGGIELISLSYTPPYNNVNYVSGFTCFCILYF